MPKTLLDVYVSKDKKPSDIIDCEFFALLSKYPLDERWIETMGIIGFCEHKKHYIDKSICFKTDDCAKKKG